MAGADSRGIKMATDCGNPAENHQTFPGSSSAVWKGFNVTSFPAAQSDMEHQPLLCLVYRLPLC